MTSSRIESRYHIVLPSDSGASLLALQDGAGYRLPGWATHEEIFWQETSTINRTFRALYGLQVATLRACKLDWSTDRRDSYYVVEALVPGWEAPADACWIDAAMAEQVAWSDPAERAVLRAWFDDQPTDKRVGWYRPGWFISAAEWIAQQADAAGLVRTGEVEQLRSWERSSIMRVDTAQGRLYFKAVAPQWGHEPALTRYLSERFPQLVPSVVAAEPDTGRMLLRAFTGTPLPEQADVDYWRRAYAALGRIQRELVDVIPELRVLGVLQRDLGSLRRAIPEILADRRRMRAGMEGGLTEAQIAMLQAAEPQLLDACERLAAGPIPCSLDHGDFWPGNIFAGDERVTLFDWSDAALTHPFFSLVTSADEIAACFPAQPEVAQLVIDGYLAAWTAYAPLAELRVIFADAMLVAPLHQALMYRTVYLPAMEFPEELDRMTPHFLRWLAGQGRERLFPTSYHSLLREPDNLHTPYAPSDSGTSGKIRSSQPGSHQFQ